ncbi:MAG: hypothetical protein KJO31_09000 [Gammaproteobacteria bacterium]|nr:hypothetical protein [Gammaproteobacteria bacterium]
MRVVFLSLFLTLVTPLALADNAVRFASVDIYLDSSAPVAAWQFELTDDNGAMKVVGVENGDSEVFSDAPYYDREAVQLGTADRIIVADFSLAGTKQLPSGNFRLTTLHLVLEGPAEPSFKLQLVTATAHDGRAIDATIRLESPTGSEQ